MLWQSVYLDLIIGVPSMLGVDLEISCDDIRYVVSPGTFRATVAKNPGVGLWAATECTGRLGASTWVELLGGSFRDL